MTKITPSFANFVPDDYQDACMISCLHGTVYYVYCITSFSGDFKCVHAYSLVGFRTGWTPPLRCMPCSLLADASSTSRASSIIACSAVVGAGCQVFLQHVQCRCISRWRCTVKCLYRTHQLHHMFGNVRDDVLAYPYCNILPLVLYFGDLEC